MSAALVGWIAPVPELAGEPQWGVRRLDGTVETAFYTGDG
jgi:hypothetical protein